MTEPAIKRIEIVAAIVTIVGALWYIMRGFLPSSLTNGAGVSPGGTVSENQPPVSMQSPMLTPVSLTSGTVPSYSANIAGGAAWDETEPMKINTAFDVSTASGQSVLGAPNGSQLALPDFLTSNLPPSADVTKAYQAIQDAGGNGNNGVNGTGGNGGGCCKPKQCTNAPPPSYFPDGKGACLSSSLGALLKSMDVCSPGASDNMLNNMLSNTRYMSIEAVPRDLYGPFLSDVYDMSVQRTFEGYDPGMIGLTTFV